MKTAIWSALALLLGACEPRTVNAAEHESKELKTYEVPAGTARDLADIIGRMGYVKDAVPEVNAQVLPDGRLAVYALPAFQRGVEPLLKSVTSHGSLVTLDFKVWQVQGKPAEKKAVGPGLASLEPQLDELIKLYGPMEFTLFSPGEVQVVSGERSEVKNELGEVRIDGNVNGDRIFARLEVDSFFGSRDEGRVKQVHLKTLVQLTPGKTVVIGQNLAPEKKGAEPASLFYLVHASIVP